MASSFKANYEGIGEMLCADYMVEAMRKRAEAGGLYAVAISPTDETGAHPGRYKDSFVAGADVPEGRKTRRAVGFLVNTSPEAPYVEHGNGTAKYQGDHVLARALDVMSS